MKKTNFISLTTLIVLLFTLSSCGNDYKSLDGMIWNTTYHITYDGDKDLSDSIYIVLNQIDASLNVFDENSVISKANASQTLRVDKDFRNVYEMSKKYNELSDGAFDPTLGPLIDAWGFGKGHKATSDTLRLKQLLANVGISKTRLEKETLIKDNPKISFNFSAIAKGYGCDRIGEMLKRNGVESYLVEIGGEIRCAGNGPHGEAWKISIDEPIQTDTINHDSECVIQVSDCGIATSGNYRNFHVEEGNTYGHTISSKTGRPVQTDVISATVVAPTSMEADALATTIMALGKDAAIELCDKLGFGVLMILNDDTIWQNEQFKKLIVKE